MEVVLTGRDEGFDGFDGLVVSLCVGLEKKGDERKASFEGFSLFSTVAPSFGSALGLSFRPTGSLSSSCLDSLLLSSLSSLPPSGMRPVATASWIVASIALICRGALRVSMHKCRTCRISSSHSLKLFAATFSLCVHSPLPAAPLAMFLSANAFMAALTSRGQGCILPGCSDATPLTFAEPSFISVPMCSAVLCRRLAVASTFLWSFFANFSNFRTFLARALSFCSRSY